jgi:hypothetical protein
MTRQLVFAHSVGWFAILTAPMALMGLCLMVLAPFWKLTDRIDSPGAAFGLFAVGLLVFAGFVCLTFWRLRKVIDLAEGSVLDNWQVLWWSRRRNYPLKAFEAVAILAGSVSSEHATYPRYKVYLVGRHGEKPLTVYLTEFTYLEQAKAKASEVATATHLPVVDSL